MTASQVTDVIEREIVVASPRSEVWAALTTVDGMAGWWSEEAEIDLRPGGAITFIWEHRTHHPAQVEAIEPESLFVFRWRPGQVESSEVYDPENTTRVEYRLEDHPDGTLVKLRESGFAALPEVVALKAFEENTGGWEHMLPRLRNFVVTGDRETAG
jgi:uncharacterized protein YndB with AHSA1/START domain